jgi:hypothetical protein
MAESRGILVENRHCINQCEAANALNETGSVTTSRFLVIKSQN